MRPTDGWGHGSPSEDAAAACERGRRRRARGSDKVVAATREYLETVDETGRRWNGRGATMDEMVKAIDVGLRPDRQAVVDPDATRSQDQTVNPRSVTQTVTQRGPSGGEGL